MNALLTTALAAIDRAATAVPDTPQGRERLITELGIARRHIRAALNKTPSPGSVDGPGLQAYFESAPFLDRHDASPQVWYVAAPLPIVHRLDVGLTLPAQRLLDLVVKTINGGHIDDPWMHPGDFDWTETSQYVEVSLMRGRSRRPQRLIVSSELAVAVSDLGAAHGHYPVSAYHAMLEATLHFTYRLFDDIHADPSRIAIQTFFMNAEGLHLDIMHGAEAAWLRLPHDRAAVAVPIEPMIVAPAALSKADTVVGDIGQALASIANAKLGDRPSS